MAMTDSMKALPGRLLLAGIAAALALAACGCPTSPPNARCVIVASPLGTHGDQLVLPQLMTMAANPTDQVVPMAPAYQRPVKCTKNGEMPGRGFDGDNPIDDLTAIVRGKSLSDGQPRSACPPFPREAVSLEEPAMKVRPCGEGACDNRQIVMRNDDVETHILFYDNPANHHPERTNESPSGGCYFRIHSMSVAWVGSAPKK
jgi:hypothetical protein